MRTTKEYKFFLKVAFVFLVTSLFFPFAFQSLSHTTRYLYRSDYDGPLLSTGSYRTWTYYWSFMFVMGNVSTPYPTLLPGMIQVCLRVGFLPAYWSWATPRFRLIFPIQIALITLGSFTVMKAKRVLSIIPFFLGMLVLTVLCNYTATLYYCTLSFGFWILIVAILFTFIALARAKKWI